MPTEKRVHLGLARTYQILTLFPRETLLHNVKLALLGLNQGALESVGQRRSHRTAKSPTRRTAALDRVGLGDQREPHRGRDFLRRTAAARTRHGLAQKPKLLLLDEPLAGLSQGRTQRPCGALLKTIPRDVTIVMIEHDMDTALEFAERITLLHYGQVIVEGTPRRSGRRSAHHGRSISVTEALAVSSIDTYLRRQPCAARCQLQTGGRPPARPARPQRRRQDHLHVDHHGLSETEARLRSRCSASGSGACARYHLAQGHRPRAAGPPRLPIA